MGGAIAAPGQPAKSLLDGTVQSGAPGQSMKGEAGGPGAPGQSMKDAGAAGGPGAPPSAPEAGAAGGPGAAPAGKAKTEAELVAGEKKDPKAEATLTADKKDPKAAAELKAGETAKKDDGTSGGPGAAKGASGAPGKTKDEDDLVDPDADRPNFGGGADEDEESAEDEDEDDALSAVANRAGKNAKQAKKLKERKPLDPAYVTMGVMMLAVAALGLLVYVGRGIMIQILPQIAGFYDKMGMDAPKEGEGLKIALSPMSLRRIGGVETLVVRGFISNIGEIPRAVPKLRLELYNEKKEVSQDAPGAAPTALLDPKGSVEFEIRMGLPQIAAAKGGYAVVWAQ